MKTVVVYCGGGIKGYTESVYSGLKNIKADLYAGTSIGGIISCARAYGKSWDEISDLFLTKGKVIFPKNIFTRARLLTKGERYSNKPLKKVLTQFFGGTKLKELSPVCLTAMCTTKANYGPHYFSELSEESVVDACMATSAAPSYFPSYNGFIDGGVFMNNPVIYALLKAHKLWPNETIKITNIGAGNSEQENRRITNLVNMAENIVPLCMDGSQMAAREMMEAYKDSLNIRYKFIDFEYPRDIKLDDTKSFEIMKEAAHVRAAN